MGFSRRRLGDTALVAHFTSELCRAYYSDAGYMILGRVVELAAGDTLDAFCAKRIFEPLGMTTTRFCPPADFAVKKLCV